MPQKRPLHPKSRREFEIAIICALALEADAVLALFDHHWDEDEDGQSYGKAHGDPNAYSTGVIGQHNVVLAHLPGMGKVAAGNTAFCRMSFPNISLALVVGICGGAPFYGKVKEDILLGDVIISTGVVQYDFGWRFPDKFKEKDTLDDSPGRPGLELRSLLSKLKTKREQGKLRIATQNFLQQALKETKNSAGYPKGLQDNLFPANYRHKHQESSTCTICAACNGKSDPVCDVALRSTCTELKCDLQQRLRCRPAEVTRDDEKERVDSNNETPFPMIHFGVFASGDMVIKSGEYRDQLTSSKGAIGFEMESVGVWDVFPSVVIKGVSDYADSHKNDDWQDFAAASAAACAKAFLKYWDSTKQ
jgi:nucleoside phosphorylase